MSQAVQNHSSLPCWISFPPCSLIAITQDVSVMLAQRGNAPAIGGLSCDLSPVRTQSRLPILPATTPTRCGTAAPPVGVCPSPPATARSHSADPPKASKAPPNEAHLIMLALPISCPAICWTLH